MSSNQSMTDDVTVPYARKLSGAKGIDRVRQKYNQWTNSKAAVLAKSVPQRLLESEHWSSGRQ